VPGVVPLPPSDLAAEELLAWTAAHFRRAVLTTGFGVEGCVLVAMVAAKRLPIDVVTLDTGILFPETYILWKRLERKYGIEIRGVVPDRTVEEQAAVHGARLWERAPDLCCQMRKVRPLARALAGYDAWVTAIRRDQTTARSTARAAEVDEQHGLVKVNPLVSWTTADVWRWALAHDVPYSPLHDEGYPSIGCVPCTSRVGEGEDARAGRWRGFGKTECGIHVNG
jgi:phosphoadenylyl-sulfate reductase (thioredoxin)